MFPALPAEVPARSAPPPPHLASGTTVSAFRSILASFPGLPRPSTQANGDKNVPNADPDASATPESGAATAETDRPDQPDPRKQGPDGAQQDPERKPDSDDGPLPEETGPSTLPQSALSGLAMPARPETQPAPAAVPDGARDPDGTESLADPDSARSAAGSDPVALSALMPVPGPVAFASGSTDSQSPIPVAAALPALARIGPIPDDGTQSALPLARPLVPVPGSTPAALDGVTAREAVLLGRLTLIRDAGAPVLSGPAAPPFGPAARFVSEPNAEPSGRGALASPVSTPASAPDRGVKARAAVAAEMAQMPDSPAFRSAIHDAKPRSGMPSVSAGGAPSADAMQMRDATPAPASGPVASGMPATPPARHSAAVLSPPKSQPAPLAPAADAPIASTTAPLETSPTLSSTGMPHQQPAIPALAQGGTAATATGIAQQIAGHVAASSPAPIAVTASNGFDMALSPEELGSVRLKLTQGEAGSLLIVQTERPETLDLMRRHVGALEQELRSLGYDALTVRFSSAGFSGHGFGQSPGGSQPGQHGQGQTADAAPHDTQHPASDASRLTLSGALQDDHLDLRL